MRAYLIIIFQVRQQHMSEVPLSEHNNVVKAFASDRTDQPFGTSILPRGAWRRWSVANAHRSKSSDEDIATVSSPKLRRDLEQLLFGLFRGEADEEATFDQLTELTGAKYPLLAYLYFLKDMERFMPIHPTGFDRAFREM